MSLNDLSARIMVLAIAAEEENARLYRDHAAAIQMRSPVSAALLEEIASEKDAHRQLLKSTYRAQFGDDPALAAAATDPPSQLAFPKPGAGRRSFVLRIVQPALTGLMDGSVSTLAPIFAAAFATSSTLAAFKVGLAASVGAGISMGFAEALSDDGKLSGRGSPWLRGLTCGSMTAIGGLGHTLPFLIGNFHTALLGAGIVVGLELAVIAWIRKKYMDTALSAAVFQVVVGGILVFLVGWLVGAG